MGLVGIEGIDAADYPAAKAAGLEISLVGSHGFGKGPSILSTMPEVETKLREAIDLAVKYEAKRVITFTGMRVAGMTDQSAKQNCIDCWKRVIGYAEQHKIMLCLEHLNSRDNTHPMKGHPVTSATTWNCASIWSRRWTRPSSGCSLTSTMYKS